MCNLKSKGWGEKSKKIEMIPPVHRLTTTYQNIRTVRLKSTIKSGSKNFNFLAQKTNKWSKPLNKWWRLTSLADSVAEKRKVSSYALVGRTWTVQRVALLFECVPSRSTRIFLCYDRSCFPAASAAAPPPFRPSLIVAGSSAAFCLRRRCRVDGTCGRDPRKGGTVEKKKREKLGEKRKSCVKKKRVLEEDSKG